MDNNIVNWPRTLRGRAFFFICGVMLALHAAGAGQGKAALKRAIPPVAAADVILYNAVVLTMEPKIPPMQAIAIKKKKILAVGKNNEILALQGPHTSVYNMRNGTVMPGFVDAHTHIFNDFTADVPDLQAAQSLAIKNGITTLANFYVTEHTLSELRAFEPQLKVRTSLYLQKNSNCGALEDDWYLNHPPTRVPGEKLRINGIKLFADGGTCGSAAVSVERVQGNGLGDLFHSQQQMNEMVNAAHAAGYQVAIHAIGDRAILQALDAIDLALDGGPNVLRHRIEHNGVLSPDVIARYKEVGAVATVFGYKRTCWLPKNLPEFYQYSENAHRTLMQLSPNTVVAWHGDDPWVEPMNPLVDLYSLTTRIDVISDGGPCDPPAWLADEAVTVLKALQMMTLNAAHALDRDGEVGSLKAGKFADLIVLSANPLAVPLAQLKDIQVEATMIGGEVLYSR